ncbi:MAG: flagellar hook capping protein [Bacteroidetes bacterium]|nr:flagellar hook capping protein [Bacteroidota bacterium]
MQLNDITSAATVPTPTTSTQSTSGSSASSSQAAASTTNNTLNESDFLQMLVTELQNQDPTNPLQSTDLAAQLAQFSSVSELQTLNQSVQSSTSANLVMTQSISNTMAATLIGKQVQVNSPNIGYDGSTQPTLGFNLTGAAADVQVKILNSNGGTVRTIDLGAKSSGDGSVVWDGKDDTGASVPAGNYTFSVTATDAQGNPVTSSSYLLGTVQGVKFDSNGPSLLVNGSEVPFSDVQEIFGN